MTPAATNQRTPRQLANDAALFRVGVINALEAEARRLDARAKRLREIATALCAPVDLPGFRRTR